MGLWDLQWQRTYILIRFDCAAPEPPIGTAQSILLRALEAASFEKSMRKWCVFITMDGTADATTIASANDATVAAVCWC